MKNYKKATKSQVERAGFSEGTIAYVVPLPNGFYSIQGPTGGTMGKVTSKTLALFVPFDKSKKF